MKCWWCCYEIPGEVYHMPYKYEKGQFLTRGQFCGWPCMKSYNIYSGSPISGRISDLMTLLRQTMYKKIEPVKAAPHRFTLVDFGGTLTIDQFRSGTVNARIKIPHEPWLYIPNESYKKTEVIMDQSDQLVLRRTKPMKKDQSALQKFILKTQS